MLLTGGARGKRSALPHARILLQQPSHPGLVGTATNIQIQVDQFLRDRELVLDIYARHTGRPKEQVERELERDYYMTPEQARVWGLIDTIVERK
jgi:ATP-dependent Clp protease protease subunit